MRYRQNVIDKSGSVNSTNAVKIPKHERNNQYRYLQFTENPDIRRNITVNSLKNIHLTLTRQV